MNQYQKQLEKKLFQCALVVEDINPHSKKTLYLNLNRDTLRSTAKEHPNYFVINGSINGTYLHSIAGGRFLRRFLKELDDKMDELLAQDKLVPELYLVGGYYPRKDGLLIFEAQHSGNNLPHIWASSPWTDLPVYRIMDDKLVRIKEGDIPSPKEVTIYTELHDRLMASLAARSPFV